MHGWGGSINSFLSVAQRLKDRFRITLIDFYGFGNTPQPNYPLYLDDYADSILEIINHYKMSEVILVGHSFGGRVAIKIASACGYLLDKIILINSAGLKPKRTLKYYYKVFTHKVLTFLKIPHKAGSADYRKLDNTGKQTFKNIINEDLNPLIEKITLPALIIWGNKDKETPIYMARKLYRKLLCPTLIIFKGEGHYAYLKRQHEFYMLLKTYLTEGPYAMADIIGAHNLRSNIIFKIPYTESK